jgi:hypothetical protein
MARDLMFQGVNISGQNELYIIHLQAFIPQKLFQRQKPRTTTKERGWEGREEGELR